MAAVGMAAGILVRMFVLVVCGVALTFAATVVVLVVRVAPEPVPAAVRQNVRMIARAPVPAVRQPVWMIARAPAQELQKLKNIGSEPATFAVICRQTKANKFS